MHQVWVGIFNNRGGITMNQFGYVAIPDLQSAKLLAIKAVVKLDYVGARIHIVEQSNYGHLQIKEYVFVVYDFKNNYFNRKNQYETMGKTI